ncbi:MAG: tRNA (uridine(34)/cytosine(34)/5-carboxymethylaminomethyluridine(34)-2'-O)-methyltransferase TrmL [Candidatus Syntrophonatronum acetioxidans]|uniref:Putative tRNA (cytidine(34)-2'-O)-methyltransferase n=1 Tax=Candidatus Syntrophonatronum acetioxidans TaxID=1795816 RepID=A0A424YDD2_9FIRM|nr:MAG: tRNA (uridine(34)/cytosine(34)/5-carboxymethylaminomethyluridine(34)-2'-O)-methyltransferase TrmL [Candidatus Syntrophonatronum acetioxidans]
MLPGERSEVVLVLHVVLVEPEIPQNVGNIARTCVLTGTPLHLIKPLGFSLEDRYLKRAGLDYWPYLNLRIYENFQEFEDEHGKKRFFLSTVKGNKIYTQINFNEDDFLLFGKETRGLSSEIIEKYKDSCLRIPMINISRSLNLSNSVAIVLYEALRQQGFPGME